MKLRIEKAIYGGSGLARIGEGELAGKTVFVPLTLPGELVEAHITEDKRSFINAEVDSILEPSPHRTMPAALTLESCGGCSYQHADYAHQVEMKTAILREALDRAHLTDLPAIKTVSGKPWQLSQPYSSSCSGDSIRAVLSQNVAPTSFLSSTNVR